MKSLRFALTALILSAAAAPAQTTDAAPTLTITTGTLVPGKKGIISGTAADTGTTGTTATAGNVQEVLFQIEGSKKWRKAKLSGKGTAAVTWFVEITGLNSTGKRIYFRVVDASGNESDVIGRRFKRSRGGAAAATTTPVTGS